MKVSINYCKIYIITSLFFGILMCIITPPLQVPDEGAHLLRAYQVSEGKNISSLNAKMEPIADIPTSLFVNIVQKVSRNLKEPKI